MVIKNNKINKNKNILAMLVMPMERVVKPKIAEIKVKRNKNTLKVSRKLGKIELNAPILNKL